MLNIEVHMKPLKESAPLQHWSCCQAFFRSANGSISVKVVARNNNNNNITHTAHTQSQQQRAEQPRRCHWRELLLQKWIFFCVILRHFTFLSLPFACLAFIYVLPHTKLNSFSAFPPTPLFLSGHHYSLPLSRSKQSGARGCVHPQKCL